MALQHGINTYKDESNFVTTKRNAFSGIPFFIGCWPCHHGAGYTGKPQLATTFNEAKALGGYTDDWSHHGDPNWSLCEAMYSHFKVFGMSPAVFYNLFDPATHKTASSESTLSVVNHCITLDVDAILDSSLVVKIDASTTAVLNTDYRAYYDDDKLIIELLPTGQAYAATSLKVAYSVANLSAIDAAAVSAAVEKIELCMGEFGFVPDLICAPGWSKIPTVAAVMAVKAANVNGLMKGKAIVDLDTSAGHADSIAGVATYKAANGYTDENMIVCWPLAKVEDKIFCMSTLLCGAIAAVDNVNDSVPSEGASNKKTAITGLLLANSTEIINPTVYQADTLSVTAGVVTALNYDGWRFWGNYTGYTDKTDAAKAFITCNRMHDFLCNSFVRMFWDYLDRPLSRMLIDAIVNRYNAFLAGLAQTGAIYGGEIIYVPDNNATADLIAGMFCLNARFASPVPAQRIDMHAEYDIAMLMSSINV